MKDKILMYCIASSLTFLIGCNKEKNAVNCSEDQFICLRDQHPKASTLQKSIVGIWEWKYIKNPMNNQYSNCNEFLGYTIEFLYNGNILIKNNGITIDQSKWSIEVIDTSASLKIDPEVAALNGWFVICEDVFGVLQSQFDGPDNYYLKKK